MSRLPVPDKRQRKIVEYCTKHKATPVEAARAFAVSRATVYRILKAHDKDLESDEPVKKPVAYDDASVDMKGKIRDDCSICGRFMYRWNEDRQAPDAVTDICSLKCMEAAKKGKRSARFKDWYKNDPVYENQLLANIGRYDSGKRTKFAFPTPEKKYMELIEISKPDSEAEEDYSDLVE
jgi:hypothetical protein